MVRELLGRGASLQDQCSEWDEQPDYLLPDLPQNRFIIQANANDLENHRAVDLADDLANNRIRKIARFKAHDVHRLAAGDPPLGPHQPPGPQQAAAHLQPVPSPASLPPKPWSTLNATRTRHAHGMGLSPREQALRERLNNVAPPPLPRAGHQRRRPSEGGRMIVDSSRSHVAAIGIGAPPRGVPKLSPRDRVNQLLEAGRQKGTATASEPNARRESEDGGVGQSWGSAPPGVLESGLSTRILRKNIKDVSRLNYRETMAARKQNATGERAERQRCAAVVARDRWQTRYFQRLAGNTWLGEEARQRLWGVEEDDQGVEDPDVAPAQVEGPHLHEQEDRQAAWFAVMAVFRSYRAYNRGLKLQQVAAKRKESATEGRLQHQRGMLVSETE